MKPRLPILVQRIFRRNDNVPTILKQNSTISDNLFGDFSHRFDKFFKFDLMGRAEFEGNIKSNSLKLMKKSKNSLVIQECVVSSRVFYFLGSKEDIITALLLFEDQCKEKLKRSPLKEPSLIQESYDDYENFPFDGWWILDNNIPFLIFKQQIHAEEWLNLL